MEPLHSNLAGSRFSLGARYTAAVTNLLESLVSSPELTLAGWSLDTPECDDNIRNVYNELWQDVSLGDTEEHRHSSMKDAEMMSQNANLALLYHQERFENSSITVKEDQKDKKDTQDYKRLATICDWTHPRYDNPLSGRFRPTFESPFFNVRVVYEWRNKQIVYAHVMLIMRTGAIVFEGELLFCELACVLGIFFHGLGNGRVIQARYDTSGVLRVRTSPIYSFQDTDNLLWRLFLRYYACSPYYGEDAEFFEDKDESGYVPSDTGSRLSSSVPAREPKHVPKKTSRLFEDKENKREP
ncbi:hypothetical protein N7539_002746 [Penicillium diatomitis]|uniref:Uncharacterized protein n=1 Tax=Penicillium diatomitis TaxID=2819901 RepID=A0A9W9XFC8_9EURO|nr:uncharacterized protein N7539_002746 [Penicillium diatomitis]KAJ5491179.1 hypothetical protein N7539_002746 [Penicillium diatomitis]